MLEVPAAHVSSLWLRNGGRTAFIPYLDNERLKGAAPAVDEDFLVKLGQRARKVMADFDLPRSPAAPSRARGMAEEGG